MSDLKKLCKVFSKQRQTPWSDWDLRDDPDADHVLVFGCPDGVGSYLQVLFNDEKMVRAEIIGPNGDPCDCFYCQKGQP